MAGSKSQVWLKPDFDVVICHLWLCVPTWEVQETIGRAARKMAFPFEAHLYRPHPQSKPIFFHHCHCQVWILQDIFSCRTFFVLYYPFAGFTAFQGLSGEWAYSLNVKMASTALLTSTMTFLCFLFPEFFKRGGYWEILQKKERFSMVNLYCKATLKLSTHF